MAMITVRVNRTDVIPGSADLGRSSALVATATVVAACMEIIGTAIRAPSAHYEHHMPLRCAVLSGVPEMNRARLIKSCITPLLQSSSSIA